MTDQTREEQAFRAALERQAQTYAPAPLRPDPRPRTWPVLAVAAAIALVVGGIATGVALGGGSQDATSTVAAPTLGSLPAPREGWKWVSWRNVAVQVPDTWSYASDDGGPCGRTAPPADTTPYVTLDQTYAVIADVACSLTGGPAEYGTPAAMQGAGESTANPAYWRAHLTFTDTSSFRGPGTYLPPGRWSYAGWTLTRAHEGYIAVSLLDRDDGDVADEVIGSVTTFTVDQNGCPASSPIQARDEVRPTPSPSDGDVTSISVCQYDRGQPVDRPGLMASRSVTGQAADDLWSSIQTAPTGGGPDEPQNCLHPTQGDTAIELRLNHPGGTATPLYVYYDSCVVGIDDGTTKRAITEADCSPLFAELPIVLWQAQEPVFKMCASE